MRHFLAALFFSCACIHSASGQTDAALGFPIMQLEPSARAAALGGSLVAEAESDINAFFYNPASLDYTMDRALSFSFLNHLTDIRAGFLAYGMDVPRLGTLGLGVRFLSWGDLERMDAQGNAEGRFNAGDVAFTAGLSYAYSQSIKIGVNINSIFSRIDDRNASALAADLGVLYVADGGYLTAGMAVNNLGFTLSSLGSSEDELPINLQVSVSRRLRYLPLRISLTGFDLNNAGTRAAQGSSLSQFMQHMLIGGEFLFSDNFNLRFGYNHRQHDALKVKSRLDFAGFSFGTGIRISRILFDYSFSSWSSIGGLHQISLGTRL